MVGVVPLLAVVKPGPSSRVVAPALSPHISRPESCQHVPLLPARAQQRRPVSGKQDLAALRDLVYLPRKNLAGIFFYDFFFLPKGW